MSFPKDHSVTPNFVTHHLDFDKQRNKLAQIEIKIEIKIIEMQYIYFPN